MAVPDLITTPGASDANSYVSLTQANEYFEVRFNSDDWTCASNEVKTRMLLQAARDLETINWMGIKYDETLDNDGNPKQALAFPRSQHNSVNGLYIIPQIKHAQCEQALFLLRQNASKEEVQHNLKRFKRGGVFVEFKNSSEALLPDLSLRHLSQKAVSLIRGWIQIGVPVRQGALG